MYDTLEMKMLKSSSFGVNLFTEHSSAEKITKLKLSENVTMIYSFSLVSK